MRKRPGVICSIGAFFLVWIVLYTGCCRLISSCGGRWCGRRWLWWRVGRLRLLLALRLFGRVSGYRPWRWLRLVVRLAWASRVSSRSLALGICVLFSRLVRSSRLCVSCCFSRSGAVCGDEALLVCHAVSSWCCSHCHLFYLCRFVVIVIERDDA